jgi:polyvinyl alcohol dehydrogenase (cytochrome)
MNFRLLIIALNLATLSILQSSDALCIEAAPAELYARTCAACHERGVPHAPHSLEFQFMGPMQIYKALTVGVMQTQGASLNDRQKRAISEFLGGRTLEPILLAAAARCGVKTEKFDFNAPPLLKGWGMSLENARFIPDRVARLSAQDVSKLAVKWAFGFPGATRARSQPMVAGGTVYVGSQDGTVYALDFETGCVRWTFQADGEVRASPVVESWKTGDRTASPRVFLVDLTATAYALEARTGKLVWKAKVDTHPRAILTASPQIFENRLYLTVSSTEWAAAGDPSYPCCTFRGGVAVLDADTGNLVWRAYSIPDLPQKTGIANSSGTMFWGPAGAPTWGSPTIDVKRRRIYVGTGDAYTSPAAPTSDSVIAFDLDSGKLLWHYQALAGDAFNLACYIGNGPNCPRENGPDLDIAAPPILVTLSGGRDLILVGQKSAEVFALDPDRDGKMLWKRRVGRGGAAAGVHWGMTFADGFLYVPNSDARALPIDEKSPAHPGLSAIDPSTGTLQWFSAAPDACSAQLAGSCDAGLSAPATSIPGVIFAGALDGHLRAYDMKTGGILWDFDTVRTFHTVNGVEGQGGTIEAAGPIVVGGMLFSNSGYMYGGRMRGNVLLAFAPTRP